VEDARGPESEFERRIREQTAYRDAKREAKLLKAGDLDAHPWVRHARKSRERSDHWPEAEEATGQSGAGTAKSRSVGLYLLLGAAALLPFLIMALSQPPASAPQASTGPIAITIWHGLADESERARLNESAAALTTEEIVFDIVRTDDLSRSIQIAVLQSRLPDIAIVDGATAELLRAGGRLINGDAEEAAGFFPLALPQPWSRPLVLIALATDRSPEEIRLILSTAEALHRLLWSESPVAPESRP